MIREEVEETREQLDAAERYLNYLWGRVKENCSAKEQAEYVEMFAINASCEAIQVAAMCRKFLDMEGSIHDGEGGQHEGADHD